MIVLWQKKILYSFFFLPHIIKLNMRSSTAPFTIRCLTETHGRVEAFAARPSKGGSTINVGRMSNNLANGFLI